jgi:AAHS family benzoate transporter-like MFS transporter
VEQINITSLITEGKLRRFHICMAVVCFFLFVFDGYDIGVYGTIVPVLIKTWKLTPVQAGAIGSYGLAGMAIGAVVFGIIADKIGRKRVMIASVFLFGVCTALCGVANDPTTFTVFRFLAGLGLGSIMPNTIAMLVDYCPKMRSMTIVNSVLCGYSIGAMIGSGLGMHLIPQFGWRSVLWVSILAVSTVPFVLYFIPESPHILVKSSNSQRLISVLKKINPLFEFNANSQFYQESDLIKKLPFFDIFKGSRAGSTVKFCFAFFAMLVLSYGMVTWFPTLVMKNGYSLKMALSCMLAWQIGGTASAPIVGILADRIGAKRVLVPLYLTAWACMMLLSMRTDIVEIYVLAALAGAGVFGAQNLVQIYMSQYYPVQMRSTALGAASCSGRIGGVVGPMVGGILLSFSFPVQTIFIAFAIPSLCAGIAIALVRDNSSRKGRGSLAGSMQDS